MKNKILGLVLSAVLAVLGTTCSGTAWQQPSNVALRGAALTLASTSWYVDPANGSDAPGNPGTTNATALKTMTELAQRWWEVDFAADTTLTILGNIPPTDVTSFNIFIRPTVKLTVLGSLGPTTGFGGTPIDNTLYSGTVTGFTAASATPAADDIELTDSGVPFSFAASGAMAEGVIWKRTSGGVLYFYGLKETVAKTERISAPMLTVRVPMSSALAVGDAYSIYQAWTIPTEQWGFAWGNIVYDSLYVNTGQALNQGTFGGRLQRVWFGPTTNNTWLFGPQTVSIVNCMFSGAASNSPNFFSTRGSTTFIAGGAARGTGTGTQILTFEGCQSLVLTSSFVSQGMSINVENTTDFVFEAPMAIHDCTGGGMIQGFNGGRVIFGLSGVTTGYGLSGKGNTSKILSLGPGMTCLYTGNAATPPFVAGASTDTAPIRIGAASFAVSALPTVPDTTLVAGATFP